MINRELIRIKIVQLTYAYYQNGNRNLDMAEKELLFSLSKAYHLYHYLLALIVAVSKEARKYYDVELSEDSLHNVNLKLTRKKLTNPIAHTSQEYNFPDKLYQVYFPDAKAYGVLKNEKLIGVIEVSEEKWSNRLRVTELYVDKDYRRRGIATCLMNYAKNLAKANNNRAIILETQTCNVNAIDFYHSQGFVFDGIETTCYNNDDIKRKEVRLELVYFIK